jgi:hypothetical protein
LPEKIEGEVPRRSAQAIDLKRVGLSGELDRLKAAKSAMGAIGKGLTSFSFKVLPCHFDIRTIPQTRQVVDKFHCLSRISRMDNARTLSEQATLLEIP